MPVKTDSSWARAAVSVLLALIVPLSFGPAYGQSGNSPGGTQPVDLVDPDPNGVPRGGDNSAADPEPGGGSSGGGATTGQPKADGGLPRGALIALVAILALGLLIGVAGSRRRTETGR